MSYEHITRRDLDGTVKVSQSYDSVLNDNKGRIGFAVTATCGPGLQNHDIVRRMRVEEEKTIGR
jgi:hypothetical protein